MYMCISLIIVSVLYVGVAESISCYNCVASSNDTLAGQTSSCDIKEPMGVCDGDFCFVTTLNYDDSIASPIKIVWRQCGKSASLPAGVNTGQCEKNNAAFNQMLYLDRNLCCYKLEYNQAQHRSNVTYCFCTDDRCNDLKYRTNFTYSDSNPTQAPGPGVSSNVPPVSNPTQAPGPGVSSNMPPVAPVTTDFNFLSGILVSVYVIPIASTAVVSVLMILSAVCLWKMSA